MYMKIRVPVSISMILFVLASCKTGPGARTEVSGYNYASPESSVFLPGVLREISEIVWVNDDIIACVQNESGTVFFYDRASQKIIRQLDFSSPGDYEGLARSADTLWVLKSNGHLFEIQGFSSDDLQVSEYEIDVPSKDSEGLCFDPVSNRLLIASKASTGKGDLTRDERYVFAFDPVKKSLSSVPAYSFIMESIIKFADSNNIKLPLKGKKKGPPVPDLKFQTSAIGIHPFTKDLYLISAEDYLLMVFKTDGTIKQMVKLNPAQYNQPEGITFLPEGDLLISNEGPDKGPGSLRRLKYHPSDK